MIASIQVRLNRYKMSPVRVEEDSDNDSVTHIQNDSKIL
jgi:hypothetical protein